MKIFLFALANIVKAFGTLWLAVEILVFFNQPDFASGIKALWWLFALAGMIYGIWISWPKKSYEFKIDGKDISLSIVRGDLFKQKGDFIVGSNTDFETSLDVISKTSIQGLFTEKFFSNHQDVSRYIESQIGTGRHDIGTTVKVRGSNNRVGYFCAVAELNAAGVAQSNIENIRVSLARLWGFIGDNGEKSELNIPILGSGFSRVNASREDLIKEIVRSFIAATSESTFCDGLRIVIHNKDIKKFDIDFSELAKFVEYSACYSLVDDSSVNGIGTAE